LAEELVRLTQQHLVIDLHHLTHFLTHFQLPTSAFPQPSSPGHYNPKEKTTNVNSKELHHKQQQRKSKIRNAIVVAFFVELRCNAPLK
jgi:hypothetical protein